ncbi:PAS domain S-box protein, partial [bacterium]|nr:PAS domain S-box protein [bacterium]
MNKSVRFSAHNNSISSFGSGIPQPPAVTAQMDQSFRKNVRKPKKVLVIDDDQDMREISRRIIESAGYQFMEATNGRDGLEQILEQRPDLVLLDFVMPVLNGEQVFIELVTSPRYRECAATPVIMLTGKSQYEVDTNRLFERGLSAFLVKPFGSKELINIIDNIFVLYEVSQKNRELEQRIRRTEYKYQDLLENANDLIFTLSLRGDFIFINRRLRTLTGYAREEWIGRSLFDLVYSDDRQNTQENFNQALQGRARIFELRLICENNTIIYLSTNINPIFEKDDVIGCVGIARDITHSKKLELEIIELKNFNESIIESIGSGLVTLDLNYRITSFNPGAEQIVGFRADEVIGKHLKDVFTEAAVTNMFPENPEESDLNREVTIPTKSGMDIYIGFTVVPRKDKHGHVVGSIITFRDITDFKHMEAQVIRMDRVASLGVLASGIAHEIRNPLAGIKTMAQSLEDELEKEDSRLEYTARIIRQVNRLDELLRRFFSLARPRPPVRKFYRLQEIVDEVFGLMQGKLMSNKVEFIPEYSGDLPLIFVDSQQIQQVLLNLMLNANDAITKDGVLRLSARPVKAKLLPVKGRNTVF